MTNFLLYEAPPILLLNFFLSFTNGEAPSIASCNCPKPTCLFTILRESIPNKYKNYVTSFSSFNILN